MLGGLYNGCRFVTLLQMLLRLTQNVPVLRLACIRHGMQVAMKELTSGWIDFAIPQSETSDGSYSCPCYENRFSTDLRPISRRFLL